MFDSLLGGKFSNKCKHAVKCTRTRLLLIRNKKQAMLRFLSKDVAELLAAGHQEIAFTRIDPLVVEINHARCYDMIDQFLECVLKNLPALQKQREASQEAVEAMSTIIFSAARFSDLPELCDLRCMFTERYGSNLEPFVNAEFADKMQAKTFSEEKNLQVMQNIAEEYSIKWNKKNFDHKASNSVALKMDQTKRTLSLPHANQPSKLLAGNIKEGLLTKGKSDIARKQEQSERETLNRFVIPSNSQVPESKEKIKIVENEIENIEPLQMKSTFPSYGKVRKKQTVDLEEDEILDGFSSSRGPKFQDKVDQRDLPQKIRMMKTVNDKPINMVPSDAKLNSKDNDFVGGIEKMLSPYSKSNHPVRQFHVEEVSNRMISAPTPRPKDTVRSSLIDDAYDNARVSMNAKSNGIKHERNVEQTKGNEVNHHSADINGTNGFRVKEKCKSDFKDGISQYRDECLDHFEQERQRNKSPDSNVKLRNLAPPYVKPPYSKSKVIDQAEDYQVPNVAGDGMFSVTNNRNHRMDEAFSDDKPKSVRRIISKTTVLDANNIPSADANVTSKISNGQNRNQGRQKTSTYNGEYDDEKLKPRDLRQPADMDDISIGQAKGANHVSDGKRRYKGRQRTDAYNDEERNGEKIKARDFECPIDDENHNGIYYGKLLPSHQSRHGSSSRHNAARKHDEEVIIDELLMQYCKKGTEKESKKDKYRSKMPMPHADRSVSMPPEPLN